MADEDGPKGEVVHPVTGELYDGDDETYAAQFGMGAGELLTYKRPEFDTAEEEMLYFLRKARDNLNALSDALPVPLSIHLTGADISIRHVMGMLGEPKASGPQPWPDVPPAKGKG